jgi:hypothetical protein
MLPSGTWVRGKLPTVGTLLRRGLLPRELVAVAARAADPGWLTTARIMSDEDKDRAAEFLALLVAAFPRERWDGGAWVPVDLDDIAEEDIDRLETVALRVMTPGEVTADSRRRLGLPDDDGEVEAGIASLTEFRRDATGADAGADGGTLVDAAERLVGSAR